MEASTIADGFYMVTCDDGKEFIFRIRTHAITEKTKPGQQVIALAKKYGSRTFINFASIQDGQITRQFCRWKDADKNQAILDAAARAMGDTDKAGKLYARTFGRCYVCNRELKVSDSLQTGIGPDCAGRRKHIELFEPTLFER